MHPTFTKGERYEKGRPQWPHGRIRRSLRRVSVERFPQKLFFSNFNFEIKDGLTNFANNYIITNLID